MNAATRDILRKVGRWSEEDQNELAALAREVESRRENFVSDEEMAQFWKRRGVR